MACHIRKNDSVIVTSGSHRGVRGKVLRVDRDKGLVVVEGVNMVYRHVRPSKRNPRGGRLQKESPIHLSNVMPYDAASGKPTRVRFALRTDAHGHVIEKSRVSARKGTLLHTLRRVKSS